MGHVRIKQYRITRGRLVRSTVGRRKRKDDGEKGGTGIEVFYRGVKTKLRD